MIQLRHTKNIIYSVIVLMLLISISLFLLKNNKKHTGQVRIEIQNDTPGRLLSDEEKDMVGIDKNQKAELVNSKEGLFIYKVVK